MIETKTVGTPTTPNITFILTISYRTARRKRNIEAIIKRLVKTEGSFKHLLIQQSSFEPRISDELDKDRRTELKPNATL